MQTLSLPQPVRSSDWRQQRRSVAPAFAPRTVHLLAIAGSLRSVALHAECRPAAAFRLYASAGARICVGTPFALTELVLVVASLVRTFRIELAPHGPVAPVGLVTLQPDAPPPFRLMPRAA
jgi:cytochrome P450